MQFSNERKNSILEMEKIINDFNATTINKARESIVSSNSILSRDISRMFEILNCNISLVKGDNLDFIKKG